MAELPSHKIPRYVIGDFKDLTSIGIGGGGMVSTGKLDDFGMIALKQFVYSRENPVNKFKKEIDILIEHRHPNIINLFGILWDGLDNSAYFGYVMEYVEGGSLHDVIHKSTRSYEFSEICKWTGQIGRGLQFLHNNGIIHRDIKPENILVAGNHLKLADFGVSKNIDASTTAGAGTLRYMAPEVFLGKCYPSSDIYSLAIVIWEIFHRKQPYFELGSVPFMRLTDKITDGTRPTIESDRMAGDVAMVIQRCWQKIPGNRPPIREIIEYFEKKTDNQLAMSPNYVGKTDVDRLSEEMDITLTERIASRTVIERKPKKSNPIKRIFNIFNNKASHNSPQLDTDTNLLHIARQDTRRLEKNIETMTILVLGGYDGNIVYDKLILLKEGKWIDLPLKLPEANNSHGTIYMEGEIYVIGGCWEEKVCKLDKNLKWTRTADMNKKRWCITNSCLKWNGCIWVFGGSSDNEGNETLKSVEKYDPKEDKWTEMPPMNQARDSAAAVVWNDKFMVCCGICDNIGLKSVECFDPESGVWTEFDYLPSPLAEHVIVSYGNKLIILGGWRGKSTNTVMELNNCEGKHVWKELSPMECSRHLFPAVVFNDEIYVIGGSDGTNKLVETEIFDGTNWRNGPDLPQKKAFMSAIVIPQHFADILLNYKP